MNDTAIKSGSQVTDGYFPYTVIATDGIWATLRMNGGGYTVRALVADLRPNN